MTSSSVLDREAEPRHLLRSLTSVSVQNRERKRRRQCLCVSEEKGKSILTAQSNDVAAVFVDKLLSHCFLHNLFHLHTKTQKLPIFHLLLQPKKHQPFKFDGPDSAEELAHYYTVNGWHLYKVCFLISSTIILLAVCALATCVGNQHFVVGLA